MATGKCVAQSTISYDRKLAIHSRNTSRNGSFALKHSVREFFKNDNRRHIRVGICCSREKYFLRKLGPMWANWAIHTLFFCMDTTVFVSRFISTRNKSYTIIRTPIHNQHWLLITEYLDMTVEICKQSRCWKHATAFTIQTWQVPSKPYYQVEYSRVLIKWDVKPKKPNQTNRTRPCGVVKRNWRCLLWHSCEYVK